MELALEGILETLLVGSLGSLCLLTLLFLLIPSLIRVKTVHLLFKFFLYEDGKSEQRPSQPSLGPLSEHSSTQSALAGGTEEQEPITAKPDDSRSLFAGVLLCAALYGAGIVAESISDRITDFSFSDGPLSGLLFSDPEVRIDAFENVGAGALVAGGASPGFEEFMTDYGACHDADLLRSSRFSSTCNAMQARAMAFYYDAKNAVYREPSYFQELSRLQTRINFTRGMGTALVALAILLGLGGCIAVLFEGAYRAQKKRMWLLRPIAAVYRALERSSALRPLVHHWTHLAEGRMFLMAAVALAVGLASQVAWRDNEDEFDRRVFGYFLSMAFAPQVAQKPDVDPTSAGLPASIYKTFEVPGQHVRFEPSAVAVIEGNKMLVANDKGSPEFVVFEFDERAGLKQPRPLTLESEQGGLEPTAASSGLPLVKVEALHTSKLSDGYRIFAAANEELAGGVNKPKLVSFRLDKTATTASELQKLSLEPDPCELVVESGSPASCVVEGLTASLSGPQEPHDLFVGLRFVGVQRQATLTLLRYKPVGPQWNGERLWTISLPSHPKTQLANSFAGSGISGLETAADGSLLVLTSFEIDEQPGSTSQVSGALWRIPAGKLSSPAPENWFADLSQPEEFPSTYLVSVFTHKPEGIAMLDNHSIIVVFDDDGKRKSRRHAPTTFALDQNQSAFTLIRPLTQGKQ